jgi:hypothetical protein
VCHQTKMIGQWNDLAVAATRHCDYASDHRVAVSSVQRHIVKHEYVAAKRTGSVVTANMPGNLGGRIDVDVAPGVFFDEEFCVGQIHA